MIINASGGVDGEEDVSLDVDMFCEVIREEYGQKWGCIGSPFEEQNAKALEEGEGIGVKFTICSLQKAFSSLRKYSKLDSSGICLESLWFFASLNPIQAVQLFNRMASDNTWVRQLEVSGHCAGKKASPATASKTRCILPPPCLLRPLDVVIGHD